MQQDNARNAWEKQEMLHEFSGRDITLFPSIEPILLCNNF
jgi:hypothetical protein